MRVCSVVGARPQFIKAAVVSEALAAAGVQEDLVHTGQHYDEVMSRVFFEEMSIPEPVVNLEVGSSSHAVQTGQMMARLEAFLVESAPYDLLVVFGDTNSTLAAALVAAKLHVPVAHVEAGLRSFNRRMPEEINRVLTDRLSDLLFCPSGLAAKNLEVEGMVAGVHHVGDVMYDALLKFAPLAASRYPAGSLTPYRPGEYLLATLHRSENTDDTARLRRLVDLLAGQEHPVVWPMHPRARKMVRAANIDVPLSIHVIEPCGYLEMISLLSSARALFTDSGGLQKEAYWSGIPCVTLRTETEWPETLVGGWNVLWNPDGDDEWPRLGVPEGGRTAPYGAGDAAAKIATVVAA